MKESAQIAHTYARRFLEAVQRDSPYFAEHAIHVHVPAGAPADVAGMLSFCLNGAGLTRCCSCWPGVWPERHWPDTLLLLLGCSAKEAAP